MYQNLTLIGNLGSDVEMRYTPSGVAVANFSMAVNKSWVDAATGEKKDKTTWFRVSCWRKQAEVVAEYLKKGQRVFVTGEVEARAYTAKDGTAACTMEVQAQTVKFLSAKGEGGQGGATPVPAGGPVAGDEVDVPF